MLWINSWIKTVLPTCTTEKSNFTTFKVRGKKANNLIPVSRISEECRQSSKLELLWIGWRLVQRSFTQITKTSSQSLYLLVQIDDLCPILPFHESTHLLIPWYDSNELYHLLTPSTSRTIFVFLHWPFVMTSVLLIQVFPCCKTKRLQRDR